VTKIGRNDVEEKLAAIKTKLIRQVAQHAGGRVITETAVPGLGLNCRTAPTSCMPVTYEPMLVVFVQGEKHVNLGTMAYRCDASTFLLTSVDLPVVSQVTKASEKEPMLALAIKLDMPMVREILSRDDFDTHEELAGTQGMAVGKITPELLEACARLVDLLDTPQDIPFMSRLILREIIYRLLRSPQGKHLRAIATLGDQSHRTAKAIAWLKENYAKPLRVEELAAIARMGVSTFHHHFRSLTALSPLQYQKQLRLHTARERMLVEGLDATSAAYEVGYESASQFSREYSRFFGQPPLRDVKARRSVAAVAQ
jgi:AraC-like DNA-binding protein